MKLAKRHGRWALGLCWLSLCASASVDPLASSAEYYYRQLNLPQALSLWNRVAERDPGNFLAVSRVAELQLLSAGRAAAREVLVEFLTGPGQNQPAEVRERARTKLTELLSLFLTDDGQSSYLRALPRLRHEDWSGALLLLNQALESDRANPLVLKEKARAERQLGQWEAYYDTLKKAYEADPYDIRVQELLAEAHLRHRAYDKAIEVLRTDRETLRTRRQRSALGVALAETGEDAEALPLLLAAADSTHAQPPPVVFAILGRILLQRPDGIAFAETYLRRFQALVPVTGPDMLPAWDAYRSRDYVSEVEKLIAKLPQRTSPPYSPRVH